ncbi:MAG TPA: hypothetical protein ENJ95_07060 [Bacteroidetes bacterium]|nr:hypothetical protein [Bacteroidota bacterium]
MGDKKAAKAKSQFWNWVYFLKNSEIKQEFSAKGIKEADKVLKRANMSDEERREYQRFVEVLSDRASIAETIEFESNLKAEEKIKEKDKKVVKNLLQLGNMTNKQIAEIAHVSVEFVEGVSEK